MREAEVFSEGTLSYFRQRLKNRLHSMILEEFSHLEDAGKLSRGGLAKRMRKRPEQVTRILAAPGNWTLDTVSDLLLGMGCELSVGVRQIARGTEESPDESWYVTRISETIPGFFGGGMETGAVRMEHSPALRVVQAEGQVVPYFSYGTTSLHTEERVSDDRSANAS